MLVAQNQDIVSQADFELISDLVYKHCGINLHDGKRELVQARIAKKLRTGGFESAAQYIDHVLADQSGERFADLIDSLSTNLTSFFREDTHFKYVSDTLIPAAIRKRAGHDQRIRCWSAGCSTGEEPYTIAITLAEALLGHGKWDVKILATDISRRVLRSAQQGFYAKERLNQVPPPLRGKYFGPAPAGTKESVQVVQALRDQIRFNYLNLQESWPFSGPFDFIFCRNVMIYFDKPTQERLVNRFHDCLAPGGVLFTGHSESLTGVAHRFRYVQPTIYMRA